ncbi:MAG: XRE family transcriptional regulator [Chloroflexi bacterium]|nr:XRE family transcriptional regulator [Chloroflexota bacterium]
MVSERMPITPEVITWAREWSGYTQDAVSDTPRLRNIADWENGTDLPTFRQLELLADKFKVPLAVFFFPEPPKVKPVQGSFRTLGPAQFAKIPPKIHLLMRKARAFQMSLEELNSGENPAKFVITQQLKIDTTVDIQDAVVRIRNALDISLAEQFSWADINEALENWRKRFYEVGVYVFKDTFGKEQGEYSGFCLYDYEFPIIYVNNSTAKSRQIFTLFHELAHLLTRTSGVLVPDHIFLEELAPSNQRLEVFCNRLAGQILVPEYAFEREIDLLPRALSPREDVQALAARFSVSREVIYRKFLDRELVSAKEYERAKEEWDAQVKPKNGGGNYYFTKLSYLGEEYVSLAFNRYYENRITELELASYLDVKPKNLDKLETTLLKNTQ